MKDLKVGETYEAFHYSGDGLISSEKVGCIVEIIQVRRKNPNLPEISMSGLLVESKWDCLVKILAYPEGWNSVKLIPFDKTDFNGYPENGMRLVNSFHSNFIKRDLTIEEKRKFKVYQRYQL